MTLAALIMLTASAAPAEPRPSHDAEIKLFASSMAIARVAKESCPGVRIDDQHLEALRLRLHVVEADHPLFAEEAGTVSSVLHQGLSEASSRQAWCDALVRLYGSDGKLIRGLLDR